MNKLNNKKSFILILTIINIVNFFNINNAVAKNNNNNIISKKQNQKIKGSSDNRNMYGECDSTCNINYDLNSLIIDNKNNLVDKETTMFYDENNNTQTYYKIYSCADYGEPNKIGNVEVKTIIKYSANYVELNRKTTITNNCEEIN